MNDWEIIRNKSIVYILLISERISLWFFRWQQWKKKWFQTYERFLLHIITALICKFCKYICILLVEIRGRNFFIVSFPNVILIVFVYFIIRIYLYLHLLLSLRIALYIYLIIDVCRYILGCHLWKFEFINRILKRYNFTRNFLNRIIQNIIAAQDFSNHPENQHIFC